MILHLGLGLILLYIGVCSDYLVMASLAAVVREHKRKICRKYNQELSHSAYVRHKNPAVCPEKCSQMLEREIDRARKSMLLESDHGEPSELTRVSLGPNKIATVPTSTFEEETEGDLVDDHSVSSSMTEGGHSCENARLSRIMILHFSVVMMTMRLLILKNLIWKIPINCLQKN